MTNHLSDDTEPTGLEEADSIATFEHLWESVEDLGEDDLPDPLDEPEDESVDEPWAAIEDLNEADPVPIDPQDEHIPDPWSEADEVPDPLAALPSAPPPVIIPPALHMPPMSEWKTSSAATRTLPWRTSARLLSPNLGELVCVADPACNKSRLLVACWEPADAEGMASLSFRVTDDGSQFTAPASRGGEGVLDCELELDGKVVALRLHLETAREERGVRLGRDVLAGHFLVDPSRDEM